MADAVRWMTYDEIAAELKIERESARQLAIRKRWARQRGNDNKARVGVPEEEFAARTADATPQGPSDGPSHDAGDNTSVAQVLERHISRLEAELETVKEQHKAERERLEGRAEALAGKVESLEQDLAAERLIATQVGALKEMLEAARLRGDELKSERDRWAEQAQKAAERRGLFGWLRRA